MPRSPLTWSRRWRPVGAWRTGSAFGQFQAACEEFVNLARADAATAHQLLHFLTLTWRYRSLAEFETERQLLIDLGVPQHYCPTRAGSGGSTWRRGEGERSARRCPGPDQGGRKGR
jgi:hypothetical protein